jgi:hypothetical protein
VREQQRGKKTDRKKRRKVLRETLPKKTDSEENGELYPAIFKPISRRASQTVCVALSRSQYHLLAQAIRNNRRTQKLLERMQALTLKTILRKAPGVRKRK